jgi:hypothetical protein
MRRANGWRENSCTICRRLARWSGKRAADEKIQEQSADAWLGGRASETADEKIRVRSAVTIG